MKPFLVTNDDEPPKGVSRIRSLPSPALAALWDSIVVPETMKEALQAQAVLNFSIRGRVDREDIPLHGIILLSGRPGTGKTSLARGLGNRVAEAFPKQSFRLLEVEPHSLTSSAMGKTQRAVSELFSQTITEAATAGPTIVLLDEVETLAADRTRLSMDANPIDIHRATDAVLVQLDILAERHPHLLFIATSNFPDAIDDAFTSRCDLVMEVPLPNAAGRLSILRKCLAGVGRTFPSIGRLAEDGTAERCARECEGLDGRAIRKMVANAIATDRRTALDPNSMTAAHLIAAAKAARTARVGIGSAL